MTVTKTEDLDIEAFKSAVEPVEAWFIEELEKQGYSDAKDLVNAFK